MAELLTGTWRLIAWRRIEEGGRVNYPLGVDARGKLMYTSNGKMAVQMMSADRAKLATSDPLGGDADARASAYSGYLAYFGTYEMRGNTVVHRLEASLFPNWTGEEQVRPFTHERDQLVLRTPPMQVADGTTVVNELTWAREES